MLLLPYFVFSLKFSLFHFNFLHSHVCSLNVNILVTNAIGPYYDNNDIDWIKQNTFILSSHTNIYNNGIIEVPRVYDAVDGWLNNVEYKRSSNNSTSFVSNNIIFGDTEFIKLNKLPGGIQTFSNNWGHGTTIITWKAIDYEDNVEQNAGETTIIVNDNFGPLFGATSDNWSYDDWNNSQNFSLTSYTNKISVFIDLPIAYDAVWGNITKFSYDISGGQANPQSISNNNEISSNPQIEFSVISSNLEGPDSSGESKYQKYIIDWHCKDNDNNSEENKSITTIKIKDEYGPIFANSESEAIDNANTNASWTQIIDGYTDSSIPRNAFDENDGSDEVFVTIIRPRAFDNVDGEISSLNYVISPNTHLKNVNDSSGTLLLDDFNPSILFKINSDYIVYGQDYQECNVIWSCVDAAGNSNENSAITIVRIHDVTIPYIIPGNMIQESLDENTISEKSITLDLPEITDNLNYAPILDYEILDGIANPQNGTNITSNPNK